LIVTDVSRKIPDITTDWDMHYDKWKFTNIFEGKRVNKVVTWLLFYYLECEEKEESHHETEESHGLGQGETQNGIREELLLKGRVAGIADDERAEDATDTGTRSSNSDGGSSSTDKLSGRVNVSGNS
jgi:hypothetical protein